MSRMYGFRKVQNAHNNWLIRDVYAEVMMLCCAAGRHDLVDLNIEGIGWRRLEKRITKILVKLGIDDDGRCYWERAHVERIL